MSAKTPTLHPRRGKSNTTKEEHCFWKTVGRTKGRTRDRKERRKKDDGRVRQKRHRETRKSLENGDCVKNHGSKKLCRTKLVTEKREGNFRKRQDT